MLVIELVVEVRVETDELKDEIDELEAEVDELRVELKVGLVVEVDEITVELVGELPSQVAVIPVVFIQPNPSIGKAGPSMKVTAAHYGSISQVKFWLSDNGQWAGQEKFKYLVKFTIRGVLNSLKDHILANPLCQSWHLWFTERSNS